MNAENYFIESIELLKQLIRTPSFSRDEKEAADVFSSFLYAKKINYKRYLNNVFAFNKYYSPNKPTLLLNSHLDTVKPVIGWTRDPHAAIIENDKLFGLGSNDAGASLCALTAAFVHFYNQENLAYNLVLAATAEEEISGKNGIASLFDLLGTIDCAIVGEPTQLQLAVAEKGLLVIDCEAKGISGHAARNEGINAIEIALEDLQQLKKISFAKISDWLGPIKITPTIINAGTQHNVIPDVCRFTLDVRVTDCYTHEEIIDHIAQHFRSSLTPRSLRLRSSYIPLSHPLVQAGISHGASCYGSPTLSDQALLPFTSLKCGPGDSARSHTADEFIYTEELYNGIEFYIHLLETFFANANNSAHTTSVAESR